MPGYALDETDSQSACLTGSDALRTCGCVIDLLKNAARFFEKKFSGSSDFNAAREALEQFEANLFFQILNLTRKGRLSHAQALLCPSVMLFLSDGHKVPELPQFHTDSISLSVRW